MNKKLFDISPRSIIPLAIAVFLGLFLFNFAVGLITGLSSLVRDMLLALILSVILYYILDPPVTWLESMGLGRGMATLLCLGTTYGLLIFLIVKFFPAFISELKNLQTIDVSRYVHEVIALVEKAQQYVSNFLPESSSVNISEKLSAWSASLTSAMINFITATIPQAIALSVTVPFFTFFFLRDADEFKKWVISFAPNRYFETTLDVVYNITVQTGLFIRGKLIESLIIAISTSMVLWYFGLKYNVLLSAFAGLSNLIPYLGPVVGAIPMAIVGLTDLGSYKEVLYLILAYFIFVQVIVDNLMVIPLLISRVSDLHPFVVLIAIIAGGKFLGIIGMFVGVPVVSILKIIFEEIYYYIRYKGLKERAVPVIAKTS